MHRMMTGWLLALAAVANGIRLRIKTHSFKHRLIGGKKVVIQSAVGGSAGLQFLNFLLGRR